MKKNKFLVPLNRSWKKLLMTMKLCLLLILISATTLIANSGYSQNKALSIHLKNATLRDLISEVEKQSEFIFVFYDKAVDLDRRIDVNIENQTIDKVLDEVLKTTELTYRIFDRQIGLGKRNSRTGEIELPNSIEKLIQPDKIIISGIVKDHKGVQLPGVSVLVKGTTTGTITDVKGEFKIAIPTGAKTILFSFVGMKSQEIEVTKKTFYEISMEEDIVAISDVVVVGYGVQKKQSIVGAIAQATNKELKSSGNVVDLKQVLTGKLAGVTTITSSGEPGGVGRGESATAVYVRGKNTWNGGSALILVDGVERAMDNIDMSEVESVSVLKDASATAVFGVKGANGVILITTKRGSESKPVVSFTYTATGKSLSKLPKKMDSYDGIMMRDRSIEREVMLSEPSWTDYIPYDIVKRYRYRQSPTDEIIFPNVDWEKAMFKDFGMSHRGNISVQGGTNFVKYFGSLAYLNEGDMFRTYENNRGYKPDYGFQRFNFRNNLDFTLTKTTKLSVNLSGYYSQKNTNYTTELADYLMWAGIYSFAPDYFLPQYPDGSWGILANITNVPNAVALQNTTGIRKTYITNMTSDFGLEQKLDFITKGLSAKASLFYDNKVISESGVYDNQAIPTTTIYPELYTGPNQDPSEYTVRLPVVGTNQFDFYPQPWVINQEAIGALNSTTSIPVERRLSYRFEMNYNRQFGLHSIGALGLFKREEYAYGNMFKNFREDWVFRTTYDYDRRYMAEINGAYNGSEKFGPGYRFDFFPSLAAGWDVSKEKFFTIQQINKLKLRYSIGWVGDDNVGGRWLYANQMEYSTDAAHLNQNTNLLSPYRFYKQTVQGNPDIHWEKAKKINYGTDLGLFDNFITASFDYFTEDRTDVLLDGSLRSMPPFFGTTPPSTNLGIVKSNGYEIELKFDKRTNWGMHYWSTISASHTKNKIIFKDDPELLVDYLKSQGYAVGQTRTQVRTGFYNSWDQIYASVPLEANDLSKIPGFYNILDFNADGVIKANDDAVPYAYPEFPENNYNLSLGADYKGFSFMLQFYGVSNTSRTFALNNLNGSRVVFEQMRDYWTKDNQDATGFVGRWKTPGQIVGDYWVYDGSYVRLKTAEVAYTLPAQLVKKMGLSNLRIYLNGNDLFLWSKLPDDRESNTYSGGSGGSRGAYPTVKRINLGFEVTL